MKRVKDTYKLFILLYVFWILLTLNLEMTNLIIGIIVSILVTLLSYDVLYDKVGFKFKFPGLFTLIIYSIKLLVEIYKSSFSYIIRIIKRDCDPVFVEVTLKVTDPFIITLIANSITLTPGTLTVEVNDNKLTVLSIRDSSKTGKDLPKYIREKFEKHFL